MTGFNTTADLPRCSVDSIRQLLDDIKYPQALLIEPLRIKGTADFHQLWILTFSSEDIKSLGLLDLDFVGDLGLRDPSCYLILRVAGNHIPRIKTDNEVGILSWLRTNTTIPVPEIFFFDNSKNNALHAEYMIMQRVSGVSGSDMYDTLTEHQMDIILDQLVDFCMQLYAHPFHHIGGLNVRGLNATEIVPGPVVSEHFWQIPDIEQYWDPTVQFEHLNPTRASGYSSYTSWLTAHMERYVMAIDLHHSLKSWLGRSEIDMLQEFIQKINSTGISEKLDTIPLRLVHRDVHFGNIMLDPQTLKTVSILDWEFSQVLPFPLWRSCFLWNGHSGAPGTWPEARKEIDRVYDQWQQNVLDLGTEGKKMLEAAKWENEEQKAAWDIVNLMRCIVEVCPRGKQEEDSRRWWKEILSTLQVFRISQEA